MRTYLTQLRKDSYVVVTGGYTDTGAVSGGNVIQEVPYGQQKEKEKKKKPKAPPIPVDDQGDQN